jgi:hypothetical protein
MLTNRVLLTPDGCRCFDRDKEDEATWLAGELLVPYAAAEHAAPANMRMNYSGARKVVERKRAYGMKRFRVR